jgi:MYXO-CTERM domain-containing protein
VVDMSGCECDPHGQPEKCGGPDVGICKSGLRSCNPDGTWGPCIGAVGPQPEQCNGLDDNCDGQTDNPPVTSTDDVPHSLCGGNQTCQNGMCVDIPGSPPPGGHNVPSGEATGCACRVGGDSAPPWSGLILTLGVVALVKVRRRK